MTTWTPHALESSARRYEGELWRVVETQRLASTVRLVDTLAEQAVLETLLEASKPPLPSGTEKLHYLLATPFRYRAPIGSRFRRPLEPGIWYGAEELRTAMAEKSYWRLRFLFDSPGTPDLVKPVPHTAFRAAVRTTRAIDLTEPPLVRDRDKWTHRTSYAATQELGTLARASQLEVIRYESVRDREHRSCAAALVPAAFRRTKPSALQTWFISASRTSVRCLKDEGGGATWEFTAEELR